MKTSINLWMVARKHKDGSPMIFKIGGVDRCMFKEKDAIHIKNNLGRAWYIFPVKMDIEYEGKPKPEDEVSNSDRIRGFTDSGNFDD
jgi:hypothetical protein